MTLYRPYREIQIINELGHSCRWSSNHKPDYGLPPPIEQIRVDEMKIKIIVFSLVILISGCSGMIWDTATYFVIKGEAFDESTKYSLNRVKVIFIDTGFDQGRSEIPNSKEIGESDEYGKINIEFGYLWGGQDITWFLKYKPKMTYDIILTKKGYKSKRFNFEAQNKARGGKANAFLGKVFLDPLL